MTLLYRGGLFPAIGRGLIFLWEKGWKLLRIKGGFGIGVCLMKAGYHPTGAPMGENSIRFSICRGTTCGARLSFTPLYRHCEPPNGGVAIP